MYDLPAEQKTAVVQLFKGIATNNSSSLSLSQRITSTNVQADSSIWLLEATLNYDFDQIPTGSETTHDSCSYEVDYMNSTVTSTDLTNAYNYFSQYINQQTTGTNKVKVIDITAFINGNKINYKANITYFPNLAQKTEGLCDAYRSTYTANWSNFFMSLHGCTFNSSNDGPTSCDAKLNCSTTAGGCDGFYWDNVQTISFGNSSPWSGLYYSPNQASDCYQTLLSGTDLNNKISTSQSYGASNLPGSSYHVVGYDVIDRELPGTVFGTLTMWWQLDITYGTYGCGGAPD